jgi:hypothetical protein
LAIFHFVVFGTMMFYSSRCALQRYPWHTYTSVFLTRSSICSSTPRRYTVSGPSQRRYSSYPDRNPVGVSASIQFFAITVNEHYRSGVYSELGSPLRSYRSWAFFLFSS